MQVDPIKPKLKAPETKRLKLRYDLSLSSFAFNFNLRRCTLARLTWNYFPAALHRPSAALMLDSAAEGAGGGGGGGQGLTLVHARAQLEQLKDTFMS